jgi:hypothetical protein
MLLQRYVRMPATAGEAFYQAAAELYLGTCAGVAGLFLDPAAGLRLQGALGIAGFALGIMKGAGGLMVRPVVGTLDAGSKCLRGFGLLCLGRRGIQGKLVRRVRPPGALEPSPAAVAAAAAAAGGDRREGGLGGIPASPSKGPTLHAALVATWQSRMPVLSPQLAGDTVMEVLATRSGRLLVLTSRHVCYLRASLPTRGSNAGSCSYSMRWCLACERVDHVRGAEESLRIILEFHTQLKLPELKGWWARRAAAAAAAKKSRSGASAAAAAGSAGGHTGSSSSAIVAAPGAPAGLDAGAAQQPPQQQEHQPHKQQQQQGQRDDSSASSRVLLRVPLHRSLRCASPELYQRVIRSISRHLVQAPAAAAAALAAAVADPTGADAGSALSLVERGGYGAGEGDYRDLYTVV